MLILTSWLKEFVPFDCSVEKLAHDLTMAGLEVEAVHSAYSDIENAVAAKILEVTTVESSPGMKKCLLDTGSGRAEVVCGAPNVERGKIAVLARPGTTLPDGTVIKKTVIYGVESAGMLCSQAELALGDDAGGIMYLQDNAALGRPVAEILGLEDWIIEIGITPNRSDCLSIQGVAREVSAAYDLPRSVPFSQNDPTGGKGLSPDSVAITIEDPEFCGRYAGAVIRGVRPGPSPSWLVRRLASCGIRPINNIVDVTNYVLLELGQPLHAFDLERLRGGEIIVRTARKGEKIKTLDGKERNLEEGMLAICDAVGPVAVAGVMGGAESEVTAGTSEILLESAWFHPSQIRRTARKLKLSTEASYRFERGVDPENCVNAMLRAASLIQQAAGGTLEAWRDECPGKFTRPVIEVRPERACSLIGAEIPRDKIIKYLQGIDIEVTENDGNIEATVPLFRPDITAEIDIVEEIARLHGFDSVPTTWPVASIIAPELDSSRALESKIKASLVASGMIEIISYSFTSPSDIEALGLPAHDPRLRMVRLKNPLSEEQSVMRTSLIPPLLRAVSRNHARRNLDLRLFELGTTFIDQGAEKLPHEETRVAALVTGKRMPRNWAWDQAQSDIFDIKGVLEALTESLGIRAEFVSCTASDASRDTYYLAGTSLMLKADDITLGSIGQITPAVLKKYEISAPVFLFDLSLEALSRTATGHKQYMRLAKYPAVELDIAIILRDEVRGQQILSFINSNRPDFLERAEIFDVYCGKPIASGFKSIAVRFIYRAPDRTLTDEQVNSIHQPLVDMLLKEFNAKLRA